MSLKTETADSGEPASGFRGERPEELPPVTPPSAGFIVQLFLIPALIVMAVVAVWALFGKLADSDTDWQQLTTELGSSNEHRRWRAALGLAQLLESEKARPASDDFRPLAENPQVIDALTKLFQTSLDSTTPTAEDIPHLEFLARIMAALEDDSKTLPLLARALQFQSDLDKDQLVRKSALLSVSAIAIRNSDISMGTKPDRPDSEGNERPVRSRAGRKQVPALANPQVLEQLKRAAQDPVPVIRHLAAWALANVGGPEAESQLKAMLFDGDRKARANAAVGLAFNGSMEGVSELQALIRDALKPFEPVAVQDLSPAEQTLARNNYPAEQAVLVRNCLRAVQDLWPGLPDELRPEFLAGLRGISKDFPAPDVRMLATNTLRELESGDAGKPSP
jgi:HEAT repeats